VHIYDYADRPAKTSIIGDALGGFSWQLLSGRTDGFGYTGYSSPMFRGDIGRDADQGTTYVKTSIDLTDADIFAELQMSMIARNNDNNLTISIRLNYIDTSNYYTFSWAVASNTWSIVRTKGGTSTTLVGPISLTRVDLAALRAEREGNILRFSYGDTIVASVVDVDPLPSGVGSVVIGGYANSAREVGGWSWRISSFNAGALHPIPEHRFQQTVTNGVIQELTFEGVWDGAAIIPVVIDGSYGSDTSVYGSYNNTTY
jgi:hypothetical protein